LAHAAATVRVEDGKVTETKDKLANIESVKGAYLAFMPDWIGADFEWLLDDVMILRAALEAIEEGCRTYIEKKYPGEPGMLLAQTTCNVARVALLSSKE
jgi:hypothetical protein